MDDLLREELLVAKTPEDKAAVVAESLFNRLPKETALVARRCILLHWFDEAIIEALSQDIPYNESQLQDIYEQLKHLPFVESLPWGLAFNHLTQEGLLHRYTRTHPELLRLSARLAAPAYRKHKRHDKKTAAEAFFCSIIAGDTTLAISLLEEQLKEATTWGDWEYIAGLFKLQDEAEKIPFVSRLPLPSEYQRIRLRVYPVLVNPAAEADAPERDITMAKQSQAVSSRRLRVFLCHSSGDKDAVRLLYQRLRACNVDPWLDEENLLPGQDWQQEIRKAVRATDIVIVCLSRGSINKAGFVQKEIKFALDVADEQPEGSIFIIPLKLEECELPERLSHFHAFNYFEGKGLEKLMNALKSRATSLGIEMAPIDGKSFIQPVLSLSKNEPSSSVHAAPALSKTTMLMSRAKKLRTNSFVLIALAALVVIGSLGFAIQRNSMTQASATATAMAKATATIQRMTPSPTTPTATVSNSYPPKNAHLALDDPLSSTTPGWGVDTFCQFIAGAYQIQSTNGLTSCTYATSYTNFVYEIRMKFVTSDPKTDTCGGIIFRFGTSSQFNSITIPYYSFLLCTSGACQLAVGGDPTAPFGRVLYRTEVCPSMDKTPSHANLIAVIAQGKKLSAFVNKVLAIPEVTVNSSSSGEIGVIAIIQQGEGKIAYNDAKVWTL